MPTSILIFTFSAISAFLYIISATAHVIRKTKASYAFATLGAAANLTVFCSHWIINGYPPFANIYQLLSVLSLAFIIIAVIFIKFMKDRLWITPYFLYGAAVPLIGTLFMENEVKWSLVPALRSPFFVPHVFAYMVSYCLAAVAFLLCIQYIFTKSRKNVILDAVLTVLRISVPFMVIGLSLGAIWADQIWGNFWSWDIKEIWSLITCVLYMCGLHLHRLRNKTFAVVFYVIGFVSLIVTFLFVNVLPSQGSMHTYS